MFNIKGQVEELPAKQVTLEKELQKLLEENMSTFFGVTFLKSEYRTTNGRRMDSIGIDKNNCPVIFEYKRSVNENVINQGLSYLNWLLDHKADFKLLVMDVLGQEKADSIDWSMPCVFCIANDFGIYDEDAVNQMRNIKLIRYRMFGDDLIAFEHLNAPQAQSFSDDTILQPAKKSNCEDIDFNQYLDKADENTKNLFYSVDQYILSLGDDIFEKPDKHYLVFKKEKNVICVGAKQSSLWLNLKLNPDTVDLIPGFVEDYREKGHWGTGDLRVIIKNIEDFEKAQHLINRAYNEN